MNILLWTLQVLKNGKLRLFQVPDPDPGHGAVVPSFDVADRVRALSAFLAAGCRLPPIGPHAADDYVRDPNGMLFDVVDR